MIIRVLVTIFCWIGMHVVLFSQDLNTLYKESIAAYKAKDFHKFKDLTNQALQLHPSHPALLYNQAAAMVLNKEYDKGKKALLKLLTWNSNLTLEEDPDFAPLLNDQKIKQALQDQATTFSTKTSKSLTLAAIAGAHHLEDVLLHGNNLILTDVHQGQVLIYDLATNHMTEPIQLNGSGMAVTGSDDDQAVWVSSAMMPNFKNFEPEKENQAFLYNINPVSKKIEYSFELPDKAVLGSMICRDGLVYATNSLEPEILVFDENKKALVYTWKIDESLNLQGITIEDNILYVADYIKGIVRVDRHTGKVMNWLESPEYLLKGIDGLTSVGKNELIGIQNNSTPKRVVMIKHNGNHVQKVELLDNGVFENGEPTNGFCDEDRGFIFIANSPWPHYDKEGNPVTEKWVEQEIRLIELKAE